LRTFRHRHLHLRLTCITSQPWQRTPQPEARTALFGTLRLARCSLPTTYLFTYSHGFVHQYTCILLRLHLPNSISISVSFWSCHDVLLVVSHLHTVTAHVTARQPRQAKRLPHRTCPAHCSKSSSNLPTAHIHPTLLTIPNCRIRASNGHSMGCRECAAIKVQHSDLRSKSSANLGSLCTEESSVRARYVCAAPS
jgi:hypothetical protein